VAWVWVMLRFIWNPSVFNSLINKSLTTQSIRVLINKWLVPQMFFVWVVLCVLVEARVPYFLCNSGDLAFI
jgi:hypothetical protein